MAAPATVFESLSRSNARLEALRDLGQGISLARWTNARDRVRYENTRMHVLSLYLENGYESLRLDRGRIAGAPGAFCLMPQGAQSDWEIGGTFRFLHLYLPDPVLRAFAAETLERDPAGLELPDLTFVAAPGLARRLADLGRAAAPIATQTALAEVLHELLTAPGLGALKPAPARGGLAPATLRRLRDHIEANLDQPLSLGTLAALAGLSEFHFQRAFRARMGRSPQAYVEARRIARAEPLIATGMALAEVAAACGFAHHSHLTRVFRTHRGVTPSAWRAATRL